MKNTHLLYALIAVFALGVVVGGILFIFFQSYVSILALIGLVSVVIKTPAFIKRFSQKVRFNNETNSV